MHPGIDIAGVGIHRSRVIIAGVSKIKPLLSECEIKTPAPTKNTYNTIHRCLLLLIVWTDLRSPRLTVQR